MIKYWKNGESCALRGIYDAKVWLVQSVIVVKDDPKETVLLLFPGAQCMVPEGIHWRKNKQHYGNRWQEANQAQIVLREFTWHTNRLLIFLEPEKYFACIYFWNQASDQFNCYYINFQLPFQRSLCGFDTLDLDLDIVIDPQFNWKWKDEDEYFQGIQENGIKHEWVNGVEQSKLEALQMIEQRDYPLDGSWLDWRPNPDWIPPKLPESWKII